MREEKKRKQGEKEGRGDKKKDIVLVCVRVCLFLQRFEKVYKSFQDCTREKCLRRKNG